MFNEIFDPIWYESQWNLNEHASSAWRTTSSSVKDTRGMQTISIDIHIA